jgi:hypothetical protein
MTPTPDWMKEHERVLKLIVQKNGCIRCHYNFGEHGVNNKDYFHPNCPRRQGKGERFTRYVFVARDEVKKD